MKHDKEISRRKFLALSAAGAAVIGGAALNINPADLLRNTQAAEAKEAFIKYGMCSHTMFYLLNREFGYMDEAMEYASDPLAGGLMSTQNQCGMLWGASLAAGAELFRRNDDHALAAVSAVTATRRILDSFAWRANSVNCRDITADFANKSEMTLFMLKSLPGGFKNILCMNLAEKWMPEAVRAAKEGLSVRNTIPLQMPVNCASLVAEKLGAGDRESVMVAGFAGGMGLSGNACGALGAAIWLKSLEWCREHPGESGSKNPANKRILYNFYSVTDSEILCRRISGRHFTSSDEHTEYLENGGCSKIIDALARL